MPEIKDPFITDEETQILKQGTSQEAQSDLKESEYRARLNWFFIASRYTILVLASATVLIFGCRYLHLINEYKQVINLYLAGKDWQVIVIYSLSLAFTAGLIVSVLAVMVRLVRSKDKKKKIMADITPNQWNEFASI